MADQERLSSVDAAWLRMDRPTNLMMICGVMMFSGQLELQQLRQVIYLRLLCFHRFRQRVVDKGICAYWETDTNFDLDWHVRQIALPGAAGSIELEEVVSDLISTPLDPSKPMWQFHLIENADGGSALVLRIHHCYGDGFALMHVILSMTDSDPERPRRHAEDIVGRDNKRSTWERILGPVTEVIGDVGRLAIDVAGVGRDWISNPSHALEFAKTGVDLAAEAAIIANMTPDSRTRFKGALGVMKRVAWAQPLSLFEVKALSEALGCSINDVLLACVSGALRCYLQEQGDIVEQLEVRTMVPVNLRPPGPISELGNHFGLVFMSLPISIADPLERVFAVRTRMAELRHSQQPLVALGILAGMGVAPSVIRERVLEALAANASAVLTNMPGSRESRYLAGQRISRQVFWVPQTGGIGLGMSILSYAGKIDFGVVSDLKRVPDPSTIARLFTEQFETLLLAVMWQLCERDLQVQGKTMRNKQ
ncbi:MAG: wax ester/triacylglycerol synthase family O-acyltransferase [Undibacterium sp.]|uniref:WS/DGAT/MGAT family O-acyltransferase n=1 Tax=Undibacterium sp. TaxID=1914977 RepID=UPI002721B1C1|nr:wax ester/triacylglycerol synthase family O-acyltransferase [Undibacterium sp.]MDO8650605.1 wax ester/triacylglycerol synthase family O-acyltransferase [Undibacterium sp.]